MRKTIIDIPIRFRVPGAQNPIFQCISIQSPELYKSTLSMVGVQILRKKLHQNRSSFFLGVCCMLYTAKLYMFFCRLGLNFSCPALKFLHLKFGYWIIGHIRLDFRQRLYQSHDRQKKSSPVRHSL